VEAEDRVGVDAARAARQAEWLLRRSRVVRGEVVRARGGVTRRLDPMVVLDVEESPGTVPTRVYGFRDVAYAVPDEPVGSRVVLLCVAKPNGFVEPTAHLR
jgi:hypothetical protein